MYDFVCRVSDALRSSRRYLLFVLSTFFAVSSAHAAVGENLLTTARYKTTCGLSNFETSLASCIGPVAAWNPMQWGTNTAQFSVVTDGYGNHSAQLNVTNFVDGAAFWRHEPVAVKPSTMYRYRVKVKTAAATTAWAEVEFQLSNGNYRYLPLSTVGANTSWATFADDFYTPADAVSATVYVFLRANGSVTIDDVAVIELAPPSKPSTDTYLNYSLSRPLVTITFDDGTGDIWNNAIPLLNNKGYKTSQFVVGSFVGTSGFMNINNLVSLNNAGHELVSHSWTHRSLPTLNSTELTNETTTTQYKLRYMFPSCYLQNMLYGERCFDHFAYPYGDVNQTVINRVKSSYRSARGTNDGLNTRLINATTSAAGAMLPRYRLHAQIVLNPTAGGGGVGELNGWLANAKASNTWLILLYHRVNSAPDTYGLTPADFGAHLDAIAASGLCVTTLHEALNEVQYPTTYSARCGATRADGGDGGSDSGDGYDSSTMTQTMQVAEPTSDQIRMLNESSGLDRMPAATYSRKQYEDSRFRQ